MPLAVGKQVQLKHGREDLQRSGIYMDERCDVALLEGETGDAACSAVRLVPKIAGEATESRPNVSHLSRGARMHRSPCGTVSGRNRLM
jgi:hypothetical protein